MFHAATKLAFGRLRRSPWFLSESRGLTNVSNWCTFLMRRSSRSRYAHFGHDVPTLWRTGKGLNLIVHTAVLLRNTSSPLPVLLAIVLGIGAGLYLFVQGFRLLQRRRLLLDTPCSKIRSASMGLVEVSGLATGPYTMQSPVTSRPCYYYRTLVWEYRDQGKSKAWIKIAADCKHLSFFLEDNTGRVLVDPHNAELDLHRDFQQEFCDGFFTMKEPVPGNVRAFLMQHGISTRNKIKVEEFCIKPKNALFVLGTLGENDSLDVTSEPAVEFEPIGPQTGDSIGFPAMSLMPGISISSSITLLKAASAGSEHTPTKIVRLNPPSSKPADAQDQSQQKKITEALMRAGITNPAAWQAAGVIPGQGGVTPSPGWSDTSSAGTSRRPPVVLRKGENNPAFLISWQSREAVAKSLFWKCMAMIWGGPALALLGLYVLVGIEGWS